MNIMEYYPDTKGDDLEKYGQNLILLSPWITSEIYSNCNLQKTIDAAPIIPKTDIITLFLKQWKC